MITVFNRRLVLETHDIAKAEALTRRLRDRDVPYKLKTRIPAPHNPFPTPGDETSAFGSQQPPTNGRTLYRVYVRAGQEGF